MKKEDNIVIKYANKDGRILIPYDIRKKLDILEDTPLKIHLIEDFIVLRKVNVLEENSDIISKIKNERLNNKNFK